MIPKLILVVFLGVFGRLIKHDNRRRQGVSSAIWIPTLWVGILASRPVSTWLGFGGGSDTLEGSPMDRLFFFVMIFAAVVTLIRRRVSWSSVMSNNWPVFCFYGFLLASVLWANSPVSSFKRWFKEAGNISVLLVILTEINPEEAIRAVFVRCGYVLIPLSYIFIRWFPLLGRRYNVYSGVMEATGVTFQKNSLGAMIWVCGLIIVWDWLEICKMRDELPRRERRFQHLIHLSTLCVGGYLLYLCDSKTSMLCLAIGSGVLLASKLPLLRRRLSAMGMISTGMAIILFSLDKMFGLTEEVVHSLGRNMTFTGRTDVWRELLRLNTDPLFGTGFMSFWDDMHYRSQLPDWVAFSAHNGYLEVYLAGGFLGVLMLAVMILGTGIRVNSALSWQGDYAVVRFACFVTALVANFSESNFACMTPVGFLFLLTAFGYVQRVPAVQHSASFGSFAKAGKAVFDTSKGVVDA